MHRFLSVFRLLAAITMMAAYRLFSAAGLPMAQYRLGVSEITKITDLWVPEVIEQGMQEPVVERTAFMDSGVVVTSPELTRIASGPGDLVKIPFLIEPNHDDQLQVQDTAPELRKMVSGSQQAAVFNRVSTLAYAALANAVAGAGGDLLRAILNAVQGLRKRQRNRLVIAALKGLFDTPAAPDAVTGAFKALRLDHFLEAGASPLTANLVDSTMLLRGIALLGENSELLTGGAVLMHTDIATSLLDQDQIDVVRNSEGQIVLRSWKGMKVFTSDLLVRAGGTSGKVYSTFLCGLGSIAMGDKPQIVTDMAGEVAALQLDTRDIAKNNVALYDRTRFICHPQGAKWTPGESVPAAEDAGPSNAELADDANWALGASNVKNVRIVCVRSNG